MRDVIERHPRLKARAELARLTYRFLKYSRGVTPRECPLCAYKGRFTAFGHPPRYDAYCPNCGSLERHRLIKLWIDRAKPFDGSHALLHFAPERQLGPLIRSLVGRYETADLNPDRDVTHHVDICATGLPAASFDRIVCNHVLEHVDDARALAELRRLLVPGGVALLTTPIVEGWPESFEDPSITAPEDRLRYFGQADHVRTFGRDLRDRIRAAGFELSEFVAKEPDAHRYGLLRGETLFIATKPLAE